MVSGSGTNLQSILDAVAAGELPVDTGPILAQAAVPVLDDDTEETLHERIKVQERRLLVQTIASLAESHSAASDS